VFRFQGNRIKLVEADEARNRYPAHKAMLELLIIDPGKYITEGIMRWNAML